MSAAGRLLALTRDALAALRRDLVIVGDGAGWAIDEQTRQLAAHLPGRRPALTSSVPPFVRGKTLHFWNRYPVLEPGLARRLAARNRLIVTWSHGGAVEDVTPELRRTMERMAGVAGAFDTVHVWANLYVPVVARLGVPRERIVVLPLGVDRDRFVPSTVGRVEAKRRLGIAPDSVCLGSFQRDGDDEPKLVKGPDLLVEAAALLHAADPRVLVVLSGPARGYVRRALAARGVPFRDFGVVPAAQQPGLYHACDVYPITAREEGGPLALLEAMACGVPVVSTRVGMSLDVIRDGENGLLADVGDVPGIARAVARVLADAALGVRLAGAGFESAKRYDWRTIAPRYAAELYAR